MNHLLNIHAGSLALGFITGLIFYVVVAVIAAMVVAKNMEEKDDRNQDLYLKKLHEAGYTEDIFE